ncbi:MAG: hypothetical protein WCI72_03210 [archaeon]
MPKKKLSVKKKVVSKPVSKPVSRTVVEKKSNNCSSWIWYAIGILLLLAVLFFLYKGMTGNVITGNVVGSDPFTDMFKSGFKTIQPVLEYLLGWDMTNDTNNSFKFDDFFSMALLILLIVFSVVFISLKKIGFFNDDDHKWALWVVSVSVSLLAVRFLSAEWLITILLPYSVFGIAISAGLPFVLFFWIVKDFNKTGRKIAWIFFTVVFIFLYYARSNTAESIATDGTHYQIYLWTALIGLLMLFFDGTIQKWLNSAKVGKNVEIANKKLIVVLNDQMDECHGKFQFAVNNGGADSYHGRIPGGGLGQTGIKAYHNDLAQLKDKMKAFS